MGTGRYRSGYRETIGVGTGRLRSGYRVTVGVICYISIIYLATLNSNMIFQ